MICIQQSHSNVALQSDFNAGRCVERKRLENVFESFIVLLSGLQDSLRKIDPVRILFHMEK